MDAIQIFSVLDEMIPRDLAIKDDKIGYFGQRQDDLEIENIKVMMDLMPKDDLTLAKNDLVVSHHPPLFIPKTPTYVIHSNWDIILGGANDALVEFLGLHSLNTFDLNTGIGRVCSSSLKLDEFLEILSVKFASNVIRVVNGDKNKTLKKIAIVSGYGLSNLDFIKLAKDRNIDAFVSGDLAHAGAILAKKLDVTLIDIPHHLIEFPGLIALAELIANNNKINLPVELIDNGIPWTYLE